MPTETQRQAWIAQWSAARIALDAQRAGEIRALSAQRALDAADALLSLGGLATVAEDRKLSSGLVRQQALLHRKVAP
ncbi:MAG: hypothetical protein WCP29_17120 [Acidobacteriota bacterium]